MAKVIGTTKYKVIAGVLGSLGGAGLAAGAAVTAVTIVKTKDATKEFTISFNSNKGSEVQAQKVLNGKTGVEPVPPTRLGYEFVAWYTDPEFENIYDWSTEVDKDITLYAQYRLVEDVQQVTLTFDLGEGTLISGETVRKVNAGTKFGNINVPNFSAPIGYTFDKWSVGSDYEITSDLTVTAIYKETPEGQVFHTINFCIDGTEKWDQKAGTSLQLTVANGTTWAQVKAMSQFPTITNVGYEIGSYYIPALTGKPEDAILLEDTYTFKSEDQKSYIFNVNIHWKAVGEVSAWLVFTSLDSSYLTWVGSQSISVVDTTQWANIGKPTVKQMGATRTAWSIRKNDGTKITISDSETKTLKELLDDIFGEGLWPEPVIIEPVFDADPEFVEITFDNEDTSKGTIYGGSTIAVKGTSWKNINKPDTTPADDYTFMYWVDADGNIIDDSAQLNASTTVYARWGLTLKYIMQAVVVEDSECTITISSYNPVSLEYSIDNGHTWTGCEVGETKLNLSAESNLYIRANKDNTTLTYSSIKFTGGQVKLKGSIMGLVNRRTLSPTLGLGTFSNLFENSSGLIEVDENFLPTTNIQYRMYCSLFEGCENLTKAPKLPGTTLDVECYSRMFFGCKKLTTPPPELPATQPAYNCYSGMFCTCTSLTTAPIVKLSNNLVSGACVDMFNSCTSLHLTTDSTAEGAVWFFRCPGLSSGSTMENDAKNMFLYTDGGLPSNPTVGQNYYYIPE